MTPIAFFFDSLPVIADLIVLAAGLCWLVVREPE